MFRKDNILKLEKMCWVDKDDHWSPLVVLDLIDEIKRLQGWEIMERPVPFRQEVAYSFEVLKDED